MAYIWRETFYNMRRSGSIGTLSIIIVALTTMVFSTLLLLANYLGIEISSLKKTPFVIAFLDDGLSDLDIKILRSKIESLPQVNSVKYVSKEDALRKSAELFANCKDILEGLENMNPLPSSFEVKVNEQFLYNIAEVANVVSNFDGIEDVQHAEKTSIFIKSIQTVMIVVVSILGFASILIIWFSIMLTAYVRRDEIRIIRLIGGTNIFIRFPLLLQGVIQGLIGSILGIAILYGLFNLFSVYNLLVIDTTFLSFLPLEQIAIVISVGAFIGFVGGAAPLRKWINI